MKDFDKTALLFELILGPDMRLVNRRIDQISISSEYRRVSGVIGSFYSTQLLEDVKKRFYQIDLYGIIEYERALEVVKELKDLDKRIQQLPTINPYLAVGSSPRKYNVKTVGQIGVEISTRGMRLNEFVNHPGVLKPHRTKQVKIKLFAWYKDAKASVVDLVETSKMFIYKVRKSKVRFRSLRLQSFLQWLLGAAALGYIFICPQLEGFRTGTLDQTQANLLTYGIYALLGALALASAIRANYKHYGFRFASKVRGQVVKQEKLMDKLDKTSNDFERYVIRRTKQPRKFNKMIDSFNVIQEKQTANLNNVIDYYHCEKEYYYHRRRWLLVFNHIFFAIGAIASIAILVSKVIFKLL